MAHPLNQPVLDARGERVVAGHAILQPRVGISLSGAARSPYARLFGTLCLPAGTRRGATVLLFGTAYDRQAGWARGRGINR